MNWGICLLFRIKLSYTNKTELEELYFSCYCADVFISMYIYYNNNNIIGIVSSPLSWSKGQFPTGSIQTLRGPILIKR